MHTTLEEEKTGPLDGAQSAHEQHAHSPVGEASGLVVRSGPLETTLAFNKNGQVRTKVERLAGRETHWRYEYDVEGRLWGSLRNGRLAEAYQYAPHTGARTLETSGLRGVFEREYLYGPDLQLLVAGAQRFAYDEQGRMIAKTGPEGEQRFSYRRDGRLIKVELPDGETVGYDYDGQGRLRGRSLDVVDVHAFEWDGPRLTNFFNGAFHAFEYGQGRMPVTMVRNGAQRFTLGFDQIGSLCAVADDTGKLVKTVEYDSWGNVLQDTNPGLEIPFGFGGGIQDELTGQVLFHHRHYDPSIARWTTPDPIGQHGGDVDHYGYCLDDPIGRIDPSGLKADCISADGNIAGFGLRGEAGLGFCWDDDKNYRGMWHGDAGAGNGWGLGASGTYQTTTAKHVDELEGTSMITGGSLTAPVFGVNVGPGFDKINSSNYSGEAYSINIGSPGPIVPETHAGTTSTLLFGN